MASLRERGIGTVELLLALIVVGAIAAAGVWAFTQDDDDNDTNPSNGTSQQPSDPDPDPTPTPDPTNTPASSIDSSEWYLFESDRYTMRVPDGWVLHYNPLSETIYDLQEGLQTYQPGVKGQVINQEDARDGAFEIIIKAIEFNPPYCDDSQMTTTTISTPNVVVERCDRPAEEQGIFPEPTPASTSYYLSQSPGVGLSATFNSVEGQDVSSLLSGQRLEVIEAMLSTISFK